MSARHKGKASRYRRGRAGRGASASDRMAALCVGKPVFVGVDLASGPDVAVEGEWRDGRLVDLREIEP